MEKNIFMNDEVIEVLMCDDIYIHIVFVVVVFVSIGFL